MQFNCGEILEESGKAPVRYYFCNACGGWHITSNPYQLHLKSKSEITIERIRDINANKKNYKDKRRKSENQTYH